MSADDQKSSKKSLIYKPIRSSPTFILLTVCLAIFNDVFLFGTIIPVLPFALPHRVSIEPGDAQIWIAVLLAMYGGALIIGSLLFGWIGDKLPRRHGLFLFGICCLLGATVLLASGRHIVLLIIGRFLQGLAAAITWTSGLGILMDLFGKERYGEAMGYGQTSVTIGTTSAPLLGGLVYARGGYSAVSAMSITTVAISLILGVVMIEPLAVSTDPETETFAKRHKSIVTNRGDGFPVLDGPLATNGVLHQNESSPLIPKGVAGDKFTSQPSYLILLRSPRILAAMIGIFTYAFVIISFEGLIPLFVKETFHWRSTQAALIFLTWIIPGFLAAVAGSASDKFGSRWIAVGGFLFSVGPLILLRLVKEDTTSHKVLLCALLTLVGIGLVWIMPSCVSELTAAAADIKTEHPGECSESGASTQAFGLFVFAYSCGTFFGPSVVGVIKAKLSWGAATLILAAACLLACIPISLKMSAVSRRRPAVEFERA